MIKKTNTNYSLQNPQISYQSSFILSETGTWGPWSEWECGNDCGNTTEARSRSCNPPDADYDASCPFPCDGDEVETSDCFAGCCPRE